MGDLLCKPLKLFRAKPLELCISYGNQRNTETPFNVKSCFILVSVLNYGSNYGSNCRGQLNAECILILVKCSTNSFFFDKTLPICYKEYVEKAEGDTVCMRVIYQSNNNSRFAFAVYGRQLPLKQTLCHDKVMRILSHPALKTTAL